MNEDKYKKIFGDSGIDPAVKKEKLRHKPPENHNKAPQATRDRFDQDAYEEGLKRIAKGKSEES